MFSRGQEEGSGDVQAMQETMVRLLQENQKIMQVLTSSWSRSGPAPAPIGAPTSIATRPSRAGLGASWSSEAWRASAPEELQEPRSGSNSRMDSGAEGASEAGAASAAASAAAVQKQQEPGGWSQVVSRGRFPRPRIAHAQEFDNTHKEPAAAAKPNRSVLDEYARRQQMVGAGGVASSATRSASVSYVLPFSAMTINMPSIFIGHMGMRTDAEDVAAAILMHWGVPATIRVMARLNRASEGVSGRSLSRSRTVSYDEEGTPYGVVIRDIQGTHEYSYGCESYLAHMGMYEAAEQEEAEQAEAGQSEGARSEEGGEGDLAPRGSWKPTWATVPQEFEGVRYEASGQRMAYVTMHKWYSPACDPIRHALLSGEQVSLNVDPDATRSWRFFKCVLGHKHPMGN